MTDMPRLQIIYDIFDAYSRCNGKVQKEQYANFVLAMLGRYGRYIKTPNFIFDKNELMKPFKIECMTYNTKMSLKF